MPFPEPDQKVVYDKNPLAEVNARFVFSSLIALENDRGAAFQERIREAYPFTVPIEHVEDGREFLSANAQWKAGVSARRLDLSTTVYRRWHQFIERLEALSDAFVDAYGEPMVLSTQLSYRDVINRAELGCEEVPWTDLLHDSLHGELADPMLESRIQGAYRRLKIELASAPGELQLTHGIEYTDDGDQVYVLESLFSHLHQGSLSDGYRYLESFHDLGSRVFRWAIKDELHDRLEPRQPNE
jgi:uncharacterized protein (TIGR04255 family)